MRITKRQTKTHLLNRVNKIPLYHLMILLSSSVTPFARYIDIIAADTQYSRGRPKTTMEALRWSTAKSLDPLIQKKVFESIRWTREERERDEPWIEWKKTKREWINEKEKERESKRGFSLDRSCGCQLNVPGQLCSWPSNGFKCESSL